MNANEGTTQISNVARRVRGVLFADYVRMVRGHQSAPWANYLLPEDMTYLSTRIEPNEWYPMATFERLGVGILHEIAASNLEAVRMWGRMSVDQLCQVSPNLVAVGDPVDTMMRFRVQRATYFDFEALEIPTLVDDHAQVVIHYYMGDIAEEAASNQTVGFFERLLEKAGASQIQARLSECSWHRDNRTLLELAWQT